MKKSIAVIMTVHNRRDTTLECIRHFYNCCGIKNYDIDFYMMDDGCTDGTANAVTCAFPQVIILKGDGNLFWNRGMYECWKEAIKKDHDFYLWLNDDTMVFDNALEELIAVYSHCPQESIIVGQICSTGDHTKPTYGGRKDGRIIPVTGEIEEVETMNGNLVLIPNRVTSKIGILSHFYKHKYGDIDYSVLARNNGVRVFITRCYVGTCDVHLGLPSCFNPNLGLRKRMAFLFSPLGLNPFEYTVFKFRTCNFLSAMKGTIYTNTYHFVRCLFPSAFIN